ncbi:MAG: 3-methyladenine DNA glycosylase [Sulfurospirillaceae bacterium]|nr:3-methyladenine DNA glycosylase [Sulfurospirillaceae bacterium]
MNSFELLKAIKENGYNASLRDPLWWPNSKSFEVVLGAILTQQAKWEKVEKSLENIKKLSTCTLEGIDAMPIDSLALLIRPSGFYNTKAKNIKMLCRAIIEDFASFESFCESVEREWLLRRKGIGQESADSILCYACQRDVMVADAYSARLLEAFGFTFESYGEVQEWLRDGIESHLDKIDILYGKKMSVNEIFARFHGKIVEFCKENSNGKKVDVSSLGL